MVDRLPWCNVIAPFHHWFCGSMSAISRPFITIKKAIRGAGDQLSLGYRKHAIEGRSGFAPSSFSARYRVLWSIEGESLSSLQIKAITLWQTAVPPTLPLYVDIRYFIPPGPTRPLALPPSPSSLSSAAPCRWLIAFSTLIGPPVWEGLPGRD